MYAMNICTTEVAVIHAVLNTFKSLAASYDVVKTLCESVRDQIRPDEAEKNAEAVVYNAIPPANDTTWKHRAQYTLLREKKDYSIFLLTPDEVTVNLGYRYAEPKPYTLEIQFNRDSRLTALRVICRIFSMDTDTYIATVHEPSSHDKIEDRHHMPVWAVLAKMADEFKTFMLTPE